MGARYIFGRGGEIQIKGLGKQVTSQVNQSRSSQRFRGSIVSGAGILPYLLCRTPTCYTQTATLPTPARPLLYTRLVKLGEQLTTAVYSY